MWLAEDTESGEEVALKVFAPTGQVSAFAGERQMRETLLLERLDHPHILRVLDHGREPVPWLAVEPHPESLKGQVRRQGKLSVAAARRMACDVLAGLAHLHSIGVVHRDIKPGNVLRTEDDRYVVADLGIARTADPRITHSGQLLGSFLYMAPEQREDPHEVDGRADLFSVAATLWFAVVGKAPPDLSMIQWRKDLLGYLPDELRLTMAKACSLEPADRYQTAKEMLAALSGQQG